MEELKFDLTDEQGIRDSIATLKKLKETRMAGAVFTIDTTPLLDFLSQILNRVLDFFDSSKKLEKQMVAAKETIRMARELGAKSIKIVIDTKNSFSLGAHIIEINATIKGSAQNGNKLVYEIEFE